jgi:IS5 family transposase
MITARRMQSDFADLWIHETVQELWEPWMRHAHKALRDDNLVDLVEAELNQRCAKSKTRGRPSYPVEVVLSMLLLKHLRDMSFATVVREVRGNLVYRQFTGIGGGTVPDEKTLGRVARQLGPKAMKRIQARMVEIARQEGVIEGVRVRMDTTVVETDIHYPTDSKLINDGVRVLTREMKRLGGAIGRKVRDSSRSVKRGVLAIARASRSRTGKGKQQMKAAYGRLLETTQRVVGQAKSVARQTALAIPLSSGKPARQWKQLNRMIPLVEQVMRQTRARVLEGNTRSEGKIVSVFEPHTAVIRKGKASKPTEFGNLVLLVEAENQIVTTYRIWEGNPADATLLIEGLESHIAVMGRAPKLLAADSGFFSAANEKRAIELGVGKVAIPLKGSKSVARLKKQKTRWFKNAQRWRTGCEGRISVVKRRHGLHRCRYKGPSGMERWVGWGIIADNFTNIGCHLAGQEEAAARAARQPAAAAPR